MRRSVQKKYMQTLICFVTVRIDAEGMHRIVQKRYMLTLAFLSLLFHCFRTASFTFPLPLARFLPLPSSLHAPFVMPPVRAPLPCLSLCCCSLLLLSFRVPLPCSMPLPCLRYSALPFRCLGLLPCLPCRCHSLGNFCKSLIGSKKFTLLNCVLCHCIIVF